MNERAHLLIAFLFIANAILFGQTDHIEDLDILEETLKSLSRQLQLQQFYTEERIRSEGGSGIKQVRIHTSGAKNYFQESFVGQSAATVHNHANNQRTVGVGEFVAVMNGIEFRTRHNDYRLYMPHPNSTVLHEIDELPFPPVPDEVDNKDTVEEQILEMREFFKAFKDQDITRRDYRPYFKAVLCYLEGAWTVPKDEIDEPFESDRHFVDAKNWFDLMDKIRYTSYTGTKSHLENLAFLPTKIIGFTDDGSPVFAQWNYRIICHQLKNDLPLSRLRVVEDLKSRMPRRRNYHFHERSRAARYQLNPLDQNEFEENPIQYQFIDDLMAEIPGKDNYQGSLTDQGFEKPPLDENTGKPLDVSRYHRWYKTSVQDSTMIHRGFSDDNLFVAMTTQPEIASMKVEFCDATGQCNVFDQKWSYAIPLEIIYLTPLYEWNPYFIEYKGSAYTKYGLTVVADGRTGSCTEPGTELNGTNSKNYYITPADFYTKGEMEPDPADTTMEVSCVLDRQGNVRQTKASGTRIHLPNIEGVGVIRQRYPLFPVPGEGSAVWKELNAVRDMVLDPIAMEALTGIKPEKEFVFLMMSPSKVKYKAIHTHYVTLTADQVEDARVSRQMLTLKTTKAEGHRHTLVIKWGPVNGWSYRKCDAKPELEICWDWHGKRMTEVDSIPEDVIL